MRTSGIEGLALRDIYILDFLTDFETCRDAWNHLRTPVLGI
jgi:hypothetical protein